MQVFGKGGKTEGYNLTLVALLAREIMDLEVLSEQNEG